MAKKFEYDLSDVHKATARMRAEHDANAGKPRLQTRTRALPDEGPRTFIRATRNPATSQTLATALGAEVDPMESAKDAYHKMASGEIKDPIIPPSAAKYIGAGLAAYQGLEAAAGATGVGNPRQAKPPEVRAPGHSLGSRGSAAGYVAEKTGKPVADVLTDNAVNRKRANYKARRDEIEGKVARGEFKTLGERAKASRELKFTRGVRGSKQLGLSSHDRRVEATTRMIRRMEEREDAKRRYREDMDARAQSQAQFEELEEAIRQSEPKSPQKEARQIVETVMAGHTSDKKPATPAKLLEDIIRKALPYGYPMVYDAVRVFAIDTNEGVRYSAGRADQLMHLARMGKGITKTGEPHGVLGVLSVIDTYAPLAPSTSSDWNTPRNILLSSQRALEFSGINKLFSNPYLRLDPVIRILGDMAPDRDPRHADLTRWFVDGMIASTMRKIGTDASPEFVDQVLTSNVASGGLKGKVLMHAASTDQLLRHGDIWTLRRVIDAGGTKARGLRQALRESNDLDKVALLARYPDMTRTDLRNLHERYGVPVSKIAEETPWKELRKGGIRGHLEFLAQHFTEVKDPNVRSALLRSRFTDMETKTAAIVPSRIEDLYGTAPFDADEDAYYALQAARKADPKFGFGQVYSGLPDMKALYSVLRSPHVSANDLRDLVLAANDSLGDAFNNNPQDANAYRGALQLLDNLNLREAWAASAQHSKKRSEAAERNYELMSELADAGLDLRGINKQWLNDVSMGDYGRAGGLDNRPWIVQRRRSLANAVSDIYDWRALNNFSTAVTLADRSPGRLGAGFDHMNSDGVGDAYRVNYIMRPGSVDLAPDVQGYWDDGHTGPSFQEVRKGSQQRRSGGYAFLQRLRLLGDPKALEQSFYKFELPVTKTGPSDSSVLPVSLALRHLANHERTIGDPFYKTPFKFAEINVERNVPAEELGGTIGAIELIKRSGRRLEGSLDRQAIERLREFAEDHGIDFVEGRSPGNTTDLDLPSELDLHKDSPYRQEDAKGGDTRQAAKGGETPGSATSVSETPVSEAPQNPGGPRIVINPQVFSDKRDALCVAFNEAFRVVMEMNGFEPASEPTEAQRKFFSDTAYADDELQLRRTILARIATLDTSVKDPTDEQLEETAEMLEMVMEVGAPQNEWEQSAVKRLHDVVVKSLESTRANGSGNPAPAPREEGSVQAAEGAGSTRNTVHRVSAPYGRRRTMPTMEALALAVERTAPRRGRHIIDVDPDELKARIAGARSQTVAPSQAPAAKAPVDAEAEMTSVLARQMKDLGFPDGVTPSHVLQLQRLFPDDTAWTDPRNWSWEPNGSRSVYYSFPAADGRGTVRRGLVAMDDGGVVPVSETLDDEGNVLSTKTWENDVERYTAFNQDGTQFSQIFEKDENGEYMPVYEGTFPETPQDWMDAWEGADEVFAPGFRESLERGEDGRYRPSAKFREWLQSGTPYEDAKGGKTSRRKYGIIRT